MSIWYLYCYYFTPQFSTVKCLPEKTSFFGTRNDFVLQFLIQKDIGHQQPQADHIPSNFFKGCLPQILLGPFLNTLSHIKVHSSLFFSFRFVSLTLSRRKPFSYRNQSIDLQSKSMDSFLYDNGLRLERVNLFTYKHFFIKN